MSVLRNRRTSIVLLSALVAVFGGACGKKDEALLNKARTIATTFHEAVISGDTRRMLDLSDYPFNFDNQEKNVADEESLKTIFDKQRASMRQKVQSANKIEVVTYNDFMAGEEFANVKLSKKEAEAQSRVIGLRKDGVLVRCYFFNSDSKKEDSRCYYLCLHPNSLGELKVTTYYD